ncbi:hypothetical protein Hanom_Chr15g01387291 [Helianthus anomalus]
MFIGEQNDRLVAPNPYPTTAPEVKRVNIVLEQNDSHCYVPVTNNEYIFYKNT